MKLAHVTHSLRGGAGKACLRLAQALNSRGLSSEIWLPHDDAEVPGVEPNIRRLPLPRGQWLSRFDRLVTPGLFWRHRSTVWTNGWMRWGTARRLNQSQSTLIHLHWVGYGMLGQREVAELRAPVVCTLHDMAVLTGGCHHAFDCEGYASGCGCCPMLRSQRSGDRSHTNASQRRAAFERKRIVLVAPSRWIEACARRSTIAREAEIVRIPHGVDGSVFAPRDQSASRRQLGLDLDRLTFFLSAADGWRNPHKGWDFVVPFIQHLQSAEPARKFQCLVAGTEQVPTELTSLVPVHCLGQVDEESVLAAAYSAANIFLFPSRAETLGLAAVEAIACGCPVLAFRVGGIPDVVVDGDSGAIASQIDVDSLVAAAMRITTRPVAQWRETCRAHFDRTFRIQAQAAAHQALYERLVEAEERRARDSLS